MRTRSPDTRPAPTVAFLALLATGGCPTAPPAAPAVPPPQPSAGPAPAPDPEACTALRAERARVIAGPEDERRASDALGACLGSGWPLGRTRAELDAVLGPGEPTGSWFPGLGFTADDRFWSIGTLPEGWVGGVPNLVAAFDAEGRCTRASPIHTQ